MDGEDDSGPGRPERSPARASREDVGNDPPQVGQAEGRGGILVERARVADGGSGLAANPRGGVVRLFPDEELATGLCVAEGLETALSAAKGFRPVWATLDAGNLAALPVPPGVEALTIVADNDPPNPATGRRAGIGAAEACAERWAAAGVEVRIWRAPAEGTDMNDFVRGAAA